ncbi:MAG: globin [Actinomycetota bacterium]|nr:globin [Actinomycetota bacterium]
MYERVGGRPWFEALVECFYEGVEKDEILRPLYPEDLERPKAHLTDFLIQYWGGPADYSAKRGHPRLRMRHARFAIGATERDAWLARMSAAVRAGGLRRADETELLSYFEHAANFLMNQP